MSNRSQALICAVFLGAVCLPRAHGADTKNADVQRQIEALRTEVEALQRKVAVLERGLANAMRAADSARRGVEASRGTDAARRAAYQLHEAPHIPRPATGPRTVENLSTEPRDLGVPQAVQPQ